MNEEFDVSTLSVGKSYKFEFADGSIPPYVAVFVGVSVLTRGHYRINLKFVVESDNTPVVLTESSFGEGLGQIRRLHEVCQSTRWVCLELIDGSVEALVLHEYRLAPDKYDWKVARSIEAQSSVDAAFKFATEELRDKLQKHCLGQLIQYYLTEKDWQISDADEVSPADIEALDCLFESSVLSGMVKIQYSYGDIAWINKDDSVPSNAAVVANELQQACDDNNDGSEQLELL